MTDAKDLATLADEIEWRHAQATGGTWTAEAMDEDECCIESDDKLDALALYLDPTDAALIVALVNAAPQIIEALRAAATRQTSAPIEVCPDCDIANCHHIRARQALEPQ